jgi:hypothetical protein
MKIPLFCVAVVLVAAGCATPLLGYTGRALHRYDRDAGEIDSLINRNHE